MQLAEELKPLDIQILINNAGFGDLDRFAQSDLSKSLDMINVNIKALHILTRKLLPELMEKDRGYILNVASSAGLLPGAHHRLGHVRLLRHAQRNHVGARVGRLGGVVRGRERHAVEHVRVRVGLLIGDDGAGGRTVDQIIGQSARVSHASGQRCGRSILLRLDDATTLSLVAVSRRCSITSLSLPMNR